MSVSRILLRKGQELLSRFDRVDDSSSELYSAQTNGWNSLRFSQVFTQPERGTDPLEAVASFVVYSSSIAAL